MIRALAPALVIAASPGLAETARDGHRDCLATVIGMQGFGAELARYGHDLEPRTLDVLAALRGGFETLAKEQLGCPIQPLLSEAETAGLEVQYALEDRIDPETTQDIWESGIEAINACILIHGNEVFLEAVNAPAPPCPENG